MNTQVLALSNQKGGVGKTTTTINLGVGLARQGKKVLLVDCDPQASLTISLGVPQPDALPCTLSTLMGKALLDEPIDPEHAILHHAEGVDLLSASIELAGMEVSLVNAMSRETVLRQVLEPLKTRYDHILIDCIIAPADGVISAIDTENATFEFYPDDALRIKAIALENVLGSLQAGDTVSVRWQYIENMSEPVKGTVEKISRIPQPESKGAEEEYAVYITVEDTDCFYYGMNVTVAGEV